MQTRPKNYLAYFFLGMAGMALFYSIINFSLDSDLLTFSLLFFWGVSSFWAILYSKFFYLWGMFSTIGISGVFVLSGIYYPTEIQYLIAAVILTVIALFFLFIVFIRDKQVTTVQEE